MAASLPVARRCPSGPEPDRWLFGPAPDGSGRTLLTARPDQSWLSHGPIAVLTNQWSDALTVLALKGRPGVAIIGQSARRIGRREEFFNSLLDRGRRQAKLVGEDEGDGVRALLQQGGVGSLEKVVQARTECLIPDREVLTFQIERHMPLKG